MIGTLVFWMLFGGLTGWMTSLIVGTDKEQGVVANILVGIVGALAGGFILRMFGGNGVTGFNLYSIFVAIIGAVLTLVVAQFFINKQSNQ